MKISVITPVYNGERFLRCAMNSIHGQRGDFELEHIVCDGLSTDGTLNILKAYPRARVVSRKDSGISDAINYGMSIASGEIGAILNSDDLYKPGALSCAAEYFKAHSECMWLYGDCPIINADGRQIRRAITFYKELIGYYFSKNILLCENFINTPAVFFRLSLFKRVGGMNTEYKAASDYDLWLKMANAAGRAAHIHRDLAMFRRHELSISETSFERQFDEELRIARSYGAPLHYLIHKFNRHKIVAAYKLLNKLSRPRSGS